MNFEEIELLAAKKEELPKYSSLEDIYCYECMKNLYRDFYHKRITAEEAKNQKQKIKLEHLNAKDIHDREIESYQQKQQSIRRSGVLRPKILGALKNSDDLRLVASLMIHCIADTCQDELFRKTALKMLEENYEKQQ